jgi:hypothetical protein
MIQAWPYLCKKDIFPNLFGPLFSLLYEIIMNMWDVVGSQPGRKQHLFDKAA